MEILSHAKSIKLRINTYNQQEYTYIYTVVPATRSIALDKLPENTEERHEDRIACNKENGLKLFFYKKKKKKTERQNWDTRFSLQGDLVKVRKKPFNFIFLLLASRHALKGRS
jgi:hypothetical protein